MDEPTTPIIKEAMKLVAEKVASGSLMQQVVIRKVARSFPMTYSRHVPTSWYGIPGLSEQLKLFKIPDPSENKPKVYGMAHGVVSFGGQDFPVVVVPPTADLDAQHQLSYDAQCVASYRRRAKKDRDYDLHIIVVQSVPADSMVPRRWTVQAIRFNEIEDEDE